MEMEMGMRMETYVLSNPDRGETWQHRQEMEPEVGSEMGSNGHSPSSSALRFAVFSTYHTRSPYLTVNGET